MAADSLWQLDAVSLGAARLRDVSLEIRRGVTAVVGWSGAGKTSLLNVLVGFEPPPRGKITGAPRVAWVPQNGGLWPHCTAREHLEIARGSHDGIDALLASFDLGEKHNVRPHELSEGEQSRLAVARALATNAEVLVMDEPLVHVDPARAGKYWQRIRERVTAGASLIFSTHVPETALGEAERAICLREGRVRHEGIVAELYTHPPDAELMGFLGPGNWLTPEDARHWLGLEIATSRCFRPEQIRIEPASDGPLVVESARFCGSFAECSLRHREQNSTATFFHRPTAARVRVGEPASLCVA